MLPLVEPLVLPLVEDETPLMTKFSAVLSVLEEVWMPKVTDFPGAITPFHDSLVNVAFVPLCEPFALQKLVIGTPRSKLTVQPVTEAVPLLVSVTLAV